MHIIAEDAECSAVDRTVPSLQKVCEIDRLVCVCVRARVCVRVYCFRIIDDVSIGKKKRDRDASTVPALIAMQSSPVENELLAM